MCYGSTRHAPEVVFFFSVATCNGSSWVRVRDYAKPYKFLHTPSTKNTFKTKCFWKQWKSGNVREEFIWSFPILPPTTFFLHKHTQMEKHRGKKTLKIDRWYWFLHRSERKEKSYFFSSLITSCAVLQILNLKKVNIWEMYSHFARIQFVTRIFSFSFSSIWQSRVNLFIDLF